MVVYRSREIPLRFNSSSSTAATCFRLSVTVASNQLAFEVEALILVQLVSFITNALWVNPFARVRRVVQILQQPIVLR